MNKLILTLSILTLTVFGCSITNVESQTPLGSSKITSASMDAKASMNISEASTETQVELKGVDMPSLSALILGATLKP